ncbi:MAG: sialate O-acetylesterase [Cyclobacteriaceae bacterium]
MKIHITILLLVVSMCANANVKLPLLFNDGIVLQRNKPIPVWGWADAGEKIEIRLNNQVVKTKTGKDGKWMIHLNPEKAGGPYKMTVKGLNTIVVNDVLIGEVWICSGQSNMEFTVSNVMNAKEEISGADYPLIRQFLVEKEVSGVPKEDFKGGKWEACNATTVGGFTAVGYFFAKKLHDELKIPIGIINSSWGGTCVETWTSRGAFESSDEFKKMIAEVPLFDIDTLIEKLQRQNVDRIEKIQGFKVDIHSELPFKNSDYDDAGWPEMNAPGLWEYQQLSDLDGVVWMRKSILILKDDAGKEGVIELAKIDDQDVTYLNGVELGTTNQYDKKRKYVIPSGVLKAGVNTIAIRISDYSGGGGIWGDPANLKLTIGKTVISLSGIWKFNVVDVRHEVSPNSYPSLLYNAMINPMIPYAFQGVLWYQGEANVSRAVQYKEAFPLMISDWRNKWKQGDFPFYYVQLSSFDEFGGNSNKGSKWAELREAQTATLKVPNTGMCVTIDIGNAQDIHPTNKQDVGKRLAAIALHNIYEKDVFFNGPTFESMEIRGNKVLLSFENIGSGLMTSDKYGYVKGFEVAGANGVFHYARAYIEGNGVIVHCDKVESPVAIHYGWSDDASDCNLFNKENFPALPFRTDDWETLTKSAKYTH